VDFFKYIPEQQNASLSNSKHVKN